MLLRYGLWFVAACSADNAMTKEQLGKRLFLDQGLSSPAGQACSDCHAPKLAFRDPESDRTTSMGVLPGKFGNRNAPTALYTAYIPPLSYDEANERWTGGLFWDGRAATLEEQAAGPLLNPLEMNNPDKATVVEYLRTAPYARAFRDLYGPRALEDVDTAFANVTDAIAAYERTSELSPFASKYDRYVAGTTTLSAAEMHGLSVFQRACASCHPPPLFTDFSYVNLGIPAYPNNMFYKSNPDFVDHGLAKTTGDPAQDGKFRVPTLRNIMRTAPYGHNGYFENVPYMIEFLNTRDIGSAQVSTCSRVPGSTTPCAWPPPEIPATIDPRVGHLGLTPQEITDLTVFLGTLTDE